MKAFLQRHADQIQGVLHGFDRLRLRGSLRLLQTEGGVATWLTQLGLKISQFTQWVDDWRQRLITRTKQDAAAAGRPVIYLPGFERKEDRVQRIRDQQGVGDNGLIAVLSTLEMTRSFEVYQRRDRESCLLTRRPRKCLHYYFYYDDGRFGLTQVRLATFFPFDCHVLLNGREWLAKQLARKGIGYERRDNCLVSVADLAAAQRLLDQQPRIDWPGQLSRVLRRAHPLHAEFFSGAAALNYFWTSEQTEWATDLLFRDPSTLTRLYPQLLRRGIETFQSPDVLRFLGRKLPAHGGVNGNYAGEVRSDLQRREEGVRIKHRAGKNTVKMYNKQPTVLRVETTINDAHELKSYRRADGDPDSPRQWRPLRKSVADLPRRAELSQAANERYLESLATVSAATPLRELTDKLCQPVLVNGRRHRGLRLFDPQEMNLLAEITRGEHLITGFRNRDLRVAIFGNTEDPALRRRQAGQITRRLAILRAHGLIKKIPHTQRYQLTVAGNQALPALLALPKIPLAQLAAA